MTERKQTKRQKAREKAEYQAQARGGEVHDHLSEEYRNNGGGRGFGYTKTDGPPGDVVAEYQYDDQNREPYLRVLRTANKQFLQSYWDGRQWQWGVPDGPKIPYFLPDLIEAGPETLVLIGEGEKDAETLNRVGVSTTNSGGAGKWTEDLNHWFVGKKRIAICPDRDEPGAMHAQKVALSLSRTEGFDGEIRIVELPPMDQDPKHTDVTDWFEHYGGTKEKLLELYEAAPVYDAASADDGPKLDPELEAEFERLAALHPAEYERVRMDAAKKLKMRVPILDSEVEKRRPRNPDAEDKMQGRAFVLPVLEPWPVEVDGDQLLKELTETFHRHIIFSPSQGLATALWVIHAHALKYARYTPRLNISSPLPNCGKTQLLSMIWFLVPRALKTENFTTPVLFRMTELLHPTLLVDEVDGLLNEKSQEMVSLLNSGYQPGGLAIRLVGDDQELRGFSVWSAIALAGIGRKIPPTLLSRSITIHLRRRLKKETIERLNGQAEEHLFVLGRKIARWILDNGDRLQDADPALPEVFIDREQNNWRALIAIADLISEDWGKKARAAAVSLERDDAIDEPGVAEMVLTDVAEIIEDKGVTNQKGAKSMPSTLIVNELLNIEYRPWGEWKNPMTTTSLARLLRPFEIYPKNIRHGPQGFQAFGYWLAPIKEARERYVIDRKPDEDTDQDNDANKKQKPRNKNKQEPPM